MAAASRELLLARLSAGCEGAERLLPTHSRHSHWAESLEVQRVAFASYTGEAVAGGARVAVP